MEAEKTLKKMTEKFLDLLGFTDAGLEIQKDEEHFFLEQKSALQTKDGKNFARKEATVGTSPQRFTVKLKIEDQGILIGYHGENINSLQLILNLMLSKKLNQWQRVLVDVGDYRQEQEERLKQMAQNACQKVKFSQNPVIITGLKPFERRIIHLVLADHPEVYTESQGEGLARELVVYPKKKA